MGQAEILELLEKNKGQKYTVKEIKRYVKGTNVYFQCNQLHKYGFIKKEVKNINYGCIYYIFWVD